MFKKALRFIFLLFLASIPVFVFLNQNLIKEYLDKNVWLRSKLNAPCSKPIEYVIGEIDPRFGISEEKLRQDAAEAEKVWESSAGKELFKYNPESNFKINLIYDERQAETNEAGNLEDKLKTLDSSHDAAVDKYNTLLNQYNQKLKDYEAEVALYNKKLDTYNKDVKDYNDHGGSEDEYQRLKKEKNDLDDMRLELEKKRKDLNNLASQVNQLAQNEGEMVNAYNSEVKNYNEKFGQSREFEKGVFDGAVINIYEFKENEDLVMTLVHEMGHALGIGHLNDPKSIMYYLMGEQDMQNPKLTDEDISALRNVCKLN